MNEIEQLELELRSDDEINAIAKLHRSKEPLISKVSLDEFTKKANDSFDFDFNGENKFYPFLLPDILKDLKFQILVITGASGSGKSTFSHYFGEEEKIQWDNSKAIISNFENCSVDEVVEKLGAVGLNSIPTWCKPRNVLSVGEGFRADLARKIKSNCIIDEFTSTVDRNVALSCSRSISKYIRNNNLQNCVFVSCHKDFIDVLCPDYVIDLDDEVIYDTRGLVRRKFELSIYEKDNKREMWQIFKQHHYLSSDLNVACKMFVGYLNNEIVALCSCLPQPSGVMQNAWRIHRLVVLPDYQGLGIATKLLEWVCDLFMYHGKTIYLRTSHAKLIKYMLNSSKWKGDGIMKHSTMEYGCMYHKSINTERLSTSFKYVQPCLNTPNKKYDCLSFPKSNEKIEQITLFDIETTTKTRYQLLKENDN